MIAMRTAALGHGIALAVAWALPAGASCDLSGLVAQARGTLEVLGGEALLSITAANVAVIQLPGQEGRPITTGSTPLLELREGSAVEVGALEIAGISALISTFLDETTGAADELVVSQEQAILLSSLSCSGVDWRAEPGGVATYVLPGREAATRFSAPTLYAALLEGDDLRDGLVDPLEIDVRRGERLSDVLPEIPAIQTMVILRPRFGRLASVDVSIPAAGLPRLRGDWNSDELYFLSSVDRGAPRLEPRSPSIGLGFGEQTTIEFEAAIGQMANWSFALGIAVEPEQDLSLARLDYSFVLPESAALVTLSVGRLAPDRDGVLGIVIEDRDPWLRGIAARLDREDVAIGGFAGLQIGPDLQAWSLLDLASSGVEASFGLGWDLPQGWAVDLGLKHAFDSEETDVLLTVSLPIGVRKSGRFKIHGDADNPAIQHLRDSAAMLRGARVSTTRRAWQSLIE
jgi:hypothetical protein